MPQSCSDSPHSRFALASSRASFDGCLILHFAKYSPVPRMEQEEMMKAYREKQAAERR